MSETKSLLTKQALANSLKILINEYPISKITVKMITEHSGFNRQTFYYHFTSIYDLLYWMFEQRVLPLLKNFEKGFQWKEGMRELFDYFSNNRKLCQAVIGSNDGIYPLFVPHIRSTVEHIIHSVSKDMVQGEIESGIVTDFYIISFGGILEHWIMGHLNYTPDELIDFLDQLIGDHIAGVKMRICGGVD